ESLGPLTRQTTDKIRRVVTEAIGLEAELWAIAAGESGWHDELEIPYCFRWLALRWLWHPDAHQPGPAGIPCIRCGTPLRRPPPPPAPPQANTLASSPPPQSPPPPTPPKTRPTREHGHPPRPRPPAAAAGGFNARAPTVPSSSAPPGAPQGAQATKAPPSR